MADVTVQEIEKRYGLSLPEDFKLYLLHAAPEGEFFDENLITWWTPQRIKNISDELEHYDDEPRIAQRADKYLFFADELFWAWAWAICCDDSEDRGKVALFAGLGADRIVAGSFTDFVATYLGDSSAVGPN
jgi:hypothetical protein